MEPACNGWRVLCWYLYSLSHRRGDQVKGHYFESGSCDLAYLEVVKRQCKVKDFCKLLCNCLGKRGRRMGGGEEGGGRRKEEREEDGRGREEKGVEGGKEGKVRKLVTCICRKAFPQF